MEEELDITKLKYVLYAHKSTDYPERQTRSISDQIVRIVFLNVCIDTEKVTAYRVKEPFNTLLTDPDGNSSRLSLTTFELAFDFIKQLVKLPQLEREMKEYALLTQNQAGSKMNFIL